MMLVRGRMNGEPQSVLADEAFPPASICWGWIGACAGWLVERQNVGSARHGSATQREQRLGLVERGRVAHVGGTHVVHVAIGCLVLVLQRRVREP